MRLLGSAAALLLVASVSADPVLEPWNKAIRDIVVANNMGSSASSKLFAQVHVAQHLAVQDVLKSKNINPNDARARDAALQPELAAAVAGAGKAVLDRVAPQGATLYNRIYDNQVGPQAQENVRAAGMRAATIGEQVVQQRVNDGSNTTLPEERGSTEIGKWRPTPPDFKAGQDTQWGQVTPWVVENVPQNFRMAPPPALNSDVYRQSYMQVMDLGKISSWGRTPAQTDTAKFWEDHPETTLFTVLDQITGNFSVPDAARAYALAATTAADSRIAAMYNKWEHRSWRPVTAIPLGNGVGFEAHQEWRPLGKTAPNPEWPTSHGVFGGAFAELYKELNAGADARDFYAASPNGQMRAYRSFSEAAEDVTISRVYIGDHFGHTGQPSKELGQQVARAVIRDFDRRVGGAPPQQGRRRRKRGGKRALRAAA